METTAAAAQQEWVAELTCVSTSPAPILQPGMLFSDACCREEELLDCREEEVLGCGEEELFCKRIQLGRAVP